MTNNKQVRVVGTSLTTTAAQHIQIQFFVQATPRVDVVLVPVVKETYMLLDGALVQTFTRIMPDFLL